MFDKVQNNERILTEENATRLEKYFSGLRYIPKSIREINLKNPNRKDFAGLVALYAIKNPDKDLTVRGLARFAGFENVGGLNKFYSLYKTENVPIFKGSKIGTLLKDVGFLDSNLFDAVKMGLEIGSKDITKQIRIPDETDENVAWLAGMLTISSYDKSFARYKDKIYESKKAYVLSFREDDRELAELEFSPMMEILFNYKPQYFEMKFNGLEVRERVFDATEKVYTISPRAIVSYFRDIIEIEPEQEKRKIPFEDKKMINAFLGGVIDRCGLLENSRIRLSIPKKYVSLANDIKECLKTNPSERKWDYMFHISSENSYSRTIGKFGLHHPKWYFPEIEKLLSQRV